VWRTDGHADGRTSLRYLRRARHFVLWRAKTRNLQSTYSFVTFHTHKIITAPLFWPKYGIFSQLSEDKVADFEAMEFKNHFKLIIRAKRPIDLIQTNIIREHGVVSLHQRNKRTDEHQNKLQCTWHCSTDITFCAVVSCAYISYYQLHVVDR